MKVTLPILCLSEGCMNLLDLEMDYCLKDCDVRDMIFWTVNSISPYIEDGRTYTAVHSNGSMYLCPINIREVEKMIDRELSRDRFALNFKSQ